MENQYVCPQCRGHLRVGEYIVFRIRNKQREKGLLLLHPEVGNYTSIKHPKFRFEEGERVDFFCPICHANLVAREINENLAHVLMIDKNKEESDIFFSEIFGEECTYKLQKGKMEKFGEDSEHYTNFFGETPRY